MKIVILNLLFPLILSAFAVLFFGLKKYLELYFTNIYKKRHPEDYIY
jgi:hypothetical protein